MVMPSTKSIRKLQEIFDNAEIFPPLGNVVKRPAGKSQQSQESQAIYRPFQLDETERGQFEERAAILEYDGGMSRRAAEARALTATLAGRRLTR